jgi:hypothetical protein
MTGEAVAQVCDAFLVMDIGHTLGVVLMAFGAVEPGQRVAVAGGTLSVCIAMPQGKVMRAIVIGRVPPACCMARGTVRPEQTCVVRRLGMAADAA